MRAGTTTHQSTMTIELSGHKGYGAALDVEIEYTRTPDIPAPGPTYASGGEPACGGEVEITDIRPFASVTRLAGRQIRSALIKEYLPVPPWLDTLLRDCIDTSLMTGED